MKVAYIGQPFLFPPQNTYNRDEGCLYWATFSISKKLDKTPTETAQNPIILAVFCALQHPKSLQVN